MSEEKNIAKRSQSYKSPFAFIAPWFEDDWFPTLGTKEPSGLSISEDTTHVYVEAALPGVKPEDTEITYDKGMLWIKGERKEEENDKKRSFYRKASSSFSYHLSVPGNIDERKEPEATYKDGILTVSFTKTKESEAKKITVKKS